MASITAETHLSDQDGFDGVDENLSSLVCVSREHTRSASEWGDPEQTAGDHPESGLHNRLAAIDEVETPASYRQLPVEPTRYTDDAYIETLVVNTYPERTTGEWIEGHLSENEALESESTLDDVDVDIEYYAVRRDRAELADELSEEKARLGKAAKTKSGVADWGRLEEKDATIDMLQDRLKSGDTDFYDVLTVITVKGGNRLSVDRAIAEIEMEVEKTGGSITRYPPRPHSQTGRNSIGGRLTTKIALVAIGAGLIGAGVSSLIRRLRDDG